MQALGTVVAPAAGASACDFIGLLSEGGEVRASLKLKSSGSHCNTNNGGEGQFSPVFLFDMSSGEELIVRMLFPNVGPRSLMTRK